MYAQLPVFKYQTFDQGSISFSPLPVSPPPTSTVRYVRALTDLAPKSEEVSNNTLAGTDTAEVFDSASAPPPSSEGQHEYFVWSRIISS